MVKIAPDKSLPQTKNRGQRLTLTAEWNQKQMRGQQRAPPCRGGPLIGAIIQRFHTKLTPLKSKGCFVAEFRCSLSRYKPS